MMILLAGLVFLILLSIVTVIELMAGNGDEDLTPEQHQWLEDDQTTIRHEG